MNAASPIDNLVAVSLPVYNCASTLRRAVDSILCQTHRNLLLVVVNDGGDSPWELLADIDDDRLVRFDLCRNQGRYFADAAVLNAVDAPYFAVQDADDWSEPNRLQILIEQLQQSQKSAAFSSAFQYDAASESPRVMRFPNVNDPLTPHFKHRSHHFGVYRSDHLRAIGGYYGGFRVGYDTLLVNLVLMTGRAGYVDVPLYHRQVRPHSLTTSPATGWTSPLRKASMRKLRDLYRQAYGHFVARQTGRIDADELKRRLRRLSQLSVTRVAAKELQREKDRLKAAIRDANGNGNVSRPNLYVASSARAANVLSDWSLRDTDLKELEYRLTELRPRRILEAGSGQSTIALATYAKQTGAHVVSLEDDAGFHARTLHRLHQAKLADFVHLRLAPLHPTTCVDGRDYPWYNAKLDGPFDFVLVDGPPQDSGRKAALFAVAPHLAPKWELWLHDAHRIHEQSCLRLWRRFFHFSEEYTAGFVQLNGIFDRRDTLEQDASTVGISVLTGGRLPLLQCTIKSLEQHYPILLQKAYVVVMVNGHDRETEDFVDKLNFVDDRLVHRQSVLGVGAATSLLARTIAANSGVRWLLHLEDDWQAMAGSPTWLSDALRLLEEDRSTGQVRLRHHAEMVLDRHMITGRRIDWRPRNNALVSNHAHYTFNPSLIRVETLRDVFPCDTEREAQIRFLETNLATAQLRPGLFRHIGEGKSRRVH